MVIALDKITEPSEAEVQQAKKALELLRVDEPDSYYIVGKGEKRVEISERVYSSLIAVLEQLARGNIAMVVPIGALLTTKQAAELMNVSRTFVLKLLEEGKLDFEVIGTHKRIPFKEVYRYKQERKRSRRKALKAIVEEDDELGVALED